MLEEFGRDLSALAAVGALEPLIGRSEEVRRMIDILSMQGKNNPIIVGPPGVGKTCIVEGFAQVLNAGTVPEPLKGKKIFQLDFTAIVSGTIYRGQLEERIQRLIDELLEHREYIVFIDEFHTIALPTLNRSFDFANVLKPYLAKGEITIIGATTEEEFKKYVEEGDAALARRFVKVRVGEPPKNELKQILQRTSKRMGSRYGMVIPEVTIDRLIDLSDQYIKDRYFPDKAIDLLKEALAEKRFNMSADGMRGDLQILENILDIEIKAVEAGDLPGVEKAIAAWDEKKNMIFLRTLTPDDIAGMLAKRTGAVIGENQLVETHKRIQDLEKAFGASIIGQKRAKDAVLGACRMLGAGIRKPNKPIGSFLFLGPSGTGKTEMAKTIARAFFGDEKKLVRFDMSEFYDDHTMARLVGSPVGYIGSDEDGLLVKLMGKNPFAAVLFDEIEKADPKLFDIFLQMLDEGYVRDMKGQTASFKDAVIIITSNVGTHYYAGLEQHEFDRKFEAIQAKVLEELKRSVRPEIINRIDHVIPFSPFTKEELRAVFMKLFDETAKRIHGQKSLTIEVTEAAAKLAVDKGYDPQFGARPMRREIQRFEEMIAEALINRVIASNDQVKIDAEDQKYVLRKVYERKTD